MRRLERRSPARRACRVAPCSRPAAGSRSAERLRRQLGPPRLRRLGTATLKWAIVVLPDPLGPGGLRQRRPVPRAVARLRLADPDRREAATPCPTSPRAGTTTAPATRSPSTCGPNLTFSDGTPVDAAAVKAAIERAKNAEELGALRRPHLDQVGRRTSGDLDVVVHLTQIDYQIPLLLGERVLQITSPKAAARTRRSSTSTPVGAGPFIVTAAGPGHARRC